MWHTNWREGCPSQDNKFTQRAPCKLPLELRASCPTEALRLPLLFLISILLVILSYREDNDVQLLMILCPTPPQLILVSCTHCHEKCTSAQQQLLQH